MTRGYRKGRVFYSTRCNLG